MTSTVVSNLGTVGFFLIVSFSDLTSQLGRRKKEVDIVEYREEK